MSKYRIKIEVGSFKIEGLKIELEGTREDAQIAERIGKQFTEIIVPNLLPPVQSSGQNGVAATGNGEESDRGKSRKRRSGAGTSKTSTEEINLSVDPTKHGSPKQDWTSVQKAIWFLYVVEESNGPKELTGYAIAKNFNKHFKAAGSLSAGNVNNGLEKEKLKGAESTVGSNLDDGKMKFFLTHTGKALAKRLGTGEPVSGG